MIRFDTHLIGSVDGYRQLACSPGIGEEDAAALSDVDLGQPVLREGQVQRLVLGRRLPSGRYALTRCVVGPEDDAGRPTLAFRSLVMSQSDWIGSIRHCVPSLLGDGLWGEDAWLHGDVVQWSPRPDRTSDLGSLTPLIRGVSAGGTVLLASTTEGECAVMHVVSSVTADVAADLCWGLGLLRLVKSLHIATIDRSAGSLYRNVHSIEHWCEQFRQSQSHVDVEVTIEPRSSSISSLMWMLAAAASLVAIALILFLWPASAPLIESSGGADASPLRSPAKPAFIVEEQDHDVVPASTQPEIIIPQDISPDPIVEAPSSIDVAPVESPEPPPVVLPSDEAEIPEAKESPPAILADPVEIARQLNDLKVMSLSFLPSPRLSVAGMMQTIDGLVDKWCLSDRNTEEVHPIDQILLAGDHLDAAWALLGNGLVPVWADPVLTHAWAASLPPGPPRERDAALGARLDALGRILRTTPKLVDLAIAIDGRWTPAGADCSLRMIAVNAVSTPWVDMRPQERWDSEDVPTEAIRASQRILREMRANDKAEEME